MDLLTPKTEPIDTDLIKKETEYDENGKYFVVPGIIESFDDEKKLIKNEKNENSSTCVSFSGINTLMF